MGNHSHVTFNFYCAGHTVWYESLAESEASELNESENAQKISFYNWKPATASSNSKYIDHYFLVDLETMLISEKRVYNMHTYICIYLYVGYVLCTYSCTHTHIYIGIFASERMYVYMYTYFYFFQKV